MFSTTGGSIKSMYDVPHWIDPETGERKPSKNDYVLRKRRCGQCGTYHISKRKQCNDCQNARLRRKKAMEYKGKKNIGAYTHVIRNEDTKELFKITLGLTQMPGNHSIVYIEKEGHLLPNIYRSLKAYGQD